MKRSERFFRHGRQECWLAVSLLVGSVAAGVWAVRVAQSTGPGGVLVLAAALAVLRLAAVHAGEALRLGRLGYQEMEWEMERQPERKL